MEIQKNTSKYLRAKWLAIIFFIAVQQIREFRGEHPKLGKEKIKPLIDEFTQTHGLKTISESLLRHCAVCREERGKTGVKLNK